MSERTSISAYFSGSSRRSLLSSVPTMPSRNAERDGDDARVLEREPVEVDVGVADHRQASPVTGSTLPETTGEKVMSTMQRDEPAVHAPQRARVLNRFQNSE